MSPDGRYAYLTHVVARFNVPTTQVERGWINTNAVSLVDTGSDKLYATFLLDDIELGAANPYGLAFTPDGSKLLVAHAGTHEVGIIDRHALERRLAEKFAANPDGKKVFEGKVKADLKNMVNSCAVFFDPQRLYPAAIEVELK